jgi:2-dehydropantoate 2-reductase
MAAVADRDIESVAIVGAGAMGGLYAWHFARAGFPVTLVARGERARRLAAQGVLVNGEPIVASVFDAEADRGGAAEPVDLVLVAVKHHELAPALDDVAPLVGPQTLFLSVLNGLDSEQVIAARFGAEHVLLCVALAMDAMRVGHEVSFRQAGRLEFGDEDNTVVSDRVLSVQRALDRAGLVWETPADMRRAMWWKFMVNVGINQASAVMLAPYGAFQPDGDARSLMMALVDEVVAVSHAEGVGLDDDDVQRWYAVLAGQPAAAKTSMHQDVEAGRRTEVDIFAGRVVALGEQHAIPTPYNRAMLWILRGALGA